MPSPDQSNDDFRPPLERTLAQLEASVREQLGQSDDWDPALVEDLRLLILVRHFQGQTPDEIIAELSAMGGEEGYVTQRGYLEKLVGAAFRNGRHGEMEVQTEIVGEGGARAVFKNPVYQLAERAAERAEKLHDRARRLARGDGQSYDPALDFSTAGNATEYLTTNRRSERRYDTILLVGALLIAGAVVFTLAFR